MTTERGGLPAEDDPTKNPFLGGFGVYQGDNLGGGTGRGMSDNGSNLPILAADAAEEEEGPLTDSQRGAIVGAAKDVVVQKNKFPNTREFFAGVCSAVSKVCENLGLKKAAAWFKDLSDAVMQRVSVKDIRAARNAGKGVQDASVSDTEAKPQRPSGQHGRSV
jgi:hypothetical protein